MCALVIVDGAASLTILATNFFSVSRTRSFFRQHTHVAQLKRRKRATKNEANNGNATMTTKMITSSQQLRTLLTLITRRRRETFASSSREKCIQYSIRFSRSFSPSVSGFYSIVVVAIVEIQSDHIVGTQADIRSTRNDLHWKCCAKSWQKSHFCRTKRQWRMLQHRQQHKRNSNTKSESKTEGKVIFLYFFLRRQRKKWRRNEICRLHRTQTEKPFSMKLPFYRLSLPKPRCTHVTQTNDRTNKGSRESTEKSEQLRWTSVRAHLNNQRE